ncbi:MAG: hypothetical protein MRK01_17185 [Candidatus Scalindua sp.]|nr:hypothetical protein [Candidatus Scalindua sp.]
MYKNYNRLALLVSCLSLFVGCAIQRPVLYPNNQLNTVGDTIASQDIDLCMELAAASGLKTNPGKNIAGNTAVGSVSGAAIGGAAGSVAGHAARGAARGAAGGAAGGIIWGIFRAKEVDPTQKRFVEECLRSKGYNVIGWK